MTATTPKPVPVLVRLPADLRRRLAAAAKELRISQAAVLRRALSNYLGASE